MPFALPPLYPILDAQFLPQDREERRRFLARVTRELCDAGVRVLQLRLKRSTREEVLRDAEPVRQAADPALTLILNDYAELVDACGFHGVHLGQGDADPALVRAQLGRDAIIGLSTHTGAQLQKGDRSVANYLATGPVFCTSTKADAELAIGVEGVRAARASTRRPLVAIGGITLRDAPEVWAAGADSLAVISALFAPGPGGHLSPGRIARDFLALFR